MRCFIALLAFAACAGANPSLYRTRTGEIRPEVPCSSMIKVEVDVPYGWFRDSVIDAVVAWHRWLRVPVFYTQCDDCEAKIFVVEAAGLVDRKGKRLVGLFDPVLFDEQRGCWNLAYVWVDSETAYGPTDFLNKTLAHEFGHALGIDDSSHSASIMIKSITVASMTLPIDESQLALDVLNLAAEGGPIPPANVCLPKE